MYHDNGKPSCSSHAKYIIQAFYGITSEFPSFYHYITQIRRFYVNTWSFTEVCILDSSIWYLQSGSISWKIWKMSIINIHINMAQNLALPGWCRQWTSRLKISKQSFAKVQIVTTINYVRNQNPLSGNVLQRRRWPEQGVV